jgi:hypothetical protein
LIRNSNLSQRLAVAKVPGGEPVNSAGNLRLCAGIRQFRQPIVKDIFSGAADVVANLDRVFIVTYKSHADKSTSSYLALLFSGGRSEGEQVCFGQGNGGGMPRTVRCVAPPISIDDVRLPLGYRA